MMTADSFIIELSERLSQTESLKGMMSMATQANQIIGYPRPSPEEARNMNPPAKESAVLFPLYLRRSEWHTAFIQRSSGQGVHSGQLSFPGGRLEMGESYIEAALRETHEEIGIESSSWKVIGELSALYIPPSHFVVQPFLAVGPENPEFTLNNAEAAGIIECPISYLLQPGIIGRKDIYVSKYQRTFESGYFDIQGDTLWGATAIMVQEFRSLFGYEN
jgi:8-oxo-dGTP pyrophosphatase MutT (NUDIX family)